MRKPTPKLSIGELLAKFKADPNSLTAKELRELESAEKFRKRMAKERADRNAVAPADEAPDDGKPFQLERELQHILPEVFAGLVHAARTEHGIARLTALRELKIWAMETDAPDEPYTITPARPQDHGKVVNISEAV